MRAQNSYTVKIALVSDTVTPPTAVSVVSLRDKSEPFGLSAPGAKMDRYLYVRNIPQWLLTTHNCRSRAELGTRANCPKETFAKHELTSLIGQRAVIGHTTDNRR